MTLLRPASSCNEPLRLEEREVNERRQRQNEDNENHCKQEPTGPRHCRPPLGGEADASAFSPHIHLKLCPKSRCKAMAVDLAGGTTMTRVG